MIVLQEMMFFYKNINYLTLDIFGPTIHTRWDRQPKYLKDELTNRLVDLLEKDTFDTSKVLQKVGKHLKIVRDQYRVHLEKNPRCERPPMIPSMEWKALVEDGKEKGLIKSGKIPPGTGRYAIHSKMQR